MASIKEAVAEKIAALGPAVQDGVVTILVEQVKDKRIKAILSAQNLIEEKQKELKKIKPDQTFDKDNKLVAETFSKSNMEAKKKVEELIAKVEKALGEALGETPNFENLFKVLQNKGAAPATEAPAEE
jgi:F0F1-type ATP synthase beta subunit